MTAKHLSRKLPIIDLGNFEDPKFENNAYVLTSPRSLEACSRLSIKPVEILSKSLREFQDDLLPLGYGLRTVFEIYDKHEKERLKKLSMCQKERQKLVDGSNNLSPEWAYKAIQSLRNVTMQNEMDIEHENDVSDDDMEEKSREKSSRLQRQRTAFVTSLGHERVTERELQERLQHLNLENKHLYKRAFSRSSLFNENEQFGSRISKKGRRGESKSVPLGSSRSLTNLAYGRASSAERPATSHFGKRASSKPNVNASSRLEKVSRTGSALAKLKERNQKLIQKMILKREVEERQENERVAAHYAWEKEHEKDEAVKLALEANRISSLNERKKSEGRQRKLMKNEERENEENGLSNIRESSVKYIDRVALCMLEKRLKESKLKLEERRKQEIERRNIVELHLEQNKKEWEEFRREVKEKQEQELQRATSFKAIWEQEQAMKLKLKNLQTVRQHRERLKNVEQQKSHLKSTLRDTLDKKSTLTKRKKKKVPTATLR